MKAPLKRKVVHFAICLALALLGPFILPPHVVGFYDPLFSLLLSSDVWSGEADGAFYVIFCVEWAVYFLLIYCLGRVMLRSNKREG